MFADGLFNLENSVLAIGLLKSDLLADGLLNLD